jgi:predicted dehydrogenase
VLICTPDHWHALPFIAACEAGKDIYQEKPLAHNIVEGRAMVNAAKRFRRVVQCGTWQRSTQHFINALDFVRAGKLGKISVCRSWCVRNEPEAGIGRQEAASPPANLDWEFYLGPAALEPYRPNRAHQTFRWFFNTASGMVGDNGVHALDILLLGMGSPAPVSVDAVGGNYVLNDDRDTPDTMCVTFQFKDFVATWEHRFGNGRPLDDGRSVLGTEFIGRNGSLIVHRNDFIVFPEGNRLPDRPAEVPPTKDPTSVGRDVHIAEFLDCIRTRKPTRADAEACHRSTILCHLANMSYLLKRRIHWDAVKEEPINDREAMDCLVYQREYRKPWKLTMYPAEA